MLKLQGIYFVHETESGKRYSVGGLSGMYL